MFAVFFPALWLTMTALLGELPRWYGLMRRGRAADGRVPLAAGFHGRRRAAGSSGDLADTLAGAAGAAWPERR